MEDSDVRKVFVYNKEKDSDIHSWIESLPQRSHSDFIRKAIRNYIASEQQSSSNSSDNFNLEERVSSLERELEVIKSGNQNPIINKKDAEKERSFIDASEILKNLGK